MGSYIDKPLTRAQRVAMVVSPPVEGALERLGGPAVGGIPKAMAKTALGKKLTSSFAGRVVGGMITEGPIEEGPTSLITDMATGSLAHYGEEQHYNPVTKKYEFVPGSNRYGLNTWRNFWENSAAGSWLGGGFELAGGASEARDRKRNPDRYHQEEIPVAERTGKLRPSVLDRHYPED
jgi:hypothetical protein